MGFINQLITGGHHPVWFTLILSNIPTKFTQTGSDWIAAAGDVDFYLELGVTERLQRLGNKIVTCLKLDLYLLDGDVNQIYNNYDIL